MNGGVTVRDMEDRKVNAELREWLKRQYPLIWEEFRRRERECNEFAT